jgi:hypothetical protein
LGAKHAIENFLGMFTFEGGKGITLSKEMLSEYDALGYSCYSTSRAGLFKWTGGCMKEDYMGGFGAKDKGNIFCVHRKRAELTALAYDILSFPMMIDELMSDVPGSTSKTPSPYFIKKIFGEAAATAAMGSTPISATLRPLRDALVSESTVSAMDTSLWSPVYLNIKPFCNPWPQCIR